jgi:hypothetical protein
MVVSVPLSDAVHRLRKRQEHVEWAASVVREGQERAIFTRRAADLKTVLDELERRSPD